MIADASLDGEKPDIRAFVVKSFTTSPTIESLKRPIPAEDEVGIDVAACGLNFADLLMIAGHYQETPALPFTPGLEVAGRVRTIGAKVSGLTPGDRVAAIVGSGGLAEHAITTPERCIKLPDTMDDVTAAGFLIAYGTSHLALTRRARLRAGETVAVLGAAGGVGRTGVEVARALDARIVAVARGSDRLQVAQDAGADVLIDSEIDDLREALRSAGPIDVTYDPIGGAAGNAALRALAPEGRHLLIGFASGDLPDLKPNHLLVKNIDVIGFYWGGYLAFHPDALHNSLKELMAWHREGKIKPLVSHTFPLERVDEGLRLLRERRATGKVVITL